MGTGSVSQSDYETIEEDVKKYQKERQAFERILLTKDEALEMFSYNPFKV